MKPQLAANNNKSVVQVDSFPKTDQTIFSETLLKANQTSVPNLEFIAIVVSQTCVGDVTAMTEPTQRPSKTHFDKFDYRDVFTTGGLDALTRKDTIISPILLSIGDHHVKPIEEYAKSPEVRTAKIQAYTSDAENFRKPKLQTFEPQRDGQWRKTEDIEII